MLVLRDWQQAVCRRRVRYHASANDTLLIRINESFVEFNLRAIVLLNSDIIFLCCCARKFRRPTPVNGAQQPTAHGSRARRRSGGVCRDPTAEILVRLTDRFDFRRKQTARKSGTQSLAASPGKGCGSQAATNGPPPLARRTRRHFARVTCT